MRISALFSLPLILAALSAPAALAQETGPGTPDFVDESTQALVDIAGAKSGKEVVQALIRLADRLVVSLEEKVRAGKAKEADSIAEAYRVALREGIASMGTGKKLQEKVTLQPEDRPSQRSGEAEKNAVRTQDQERTQERTREQDQTRARETAKVQERNREESRIRTEEKAATDDVKGLVAAATERHAAALRRCLEFASPEAKRALQKALESCMEVRSRFGFSAGPGPKGEPEAPRGPGEGDGYRKGASGEPPRGMIERPAPEPPRRAP